MRTRRKDRRTDHSGKDIIASVMAMSTDQPIVRSRRRPTRKTGLRQFASNVTSQHGEDGILEALFERIGTTNQRLLDVGAWDGRHLSNTFCLLEKGWSGILIEGDDTKFPQLQARHATQTCLHAMVSVQKDHPCCITNLLKGHDTAFDFVCIDIDGGDYWILSELLELCPPPRVVCIEANPTMPHDLVYIPPRNDTARHGCSMAALVELMQDSHVLVETTVYNGIFVRRNLYDNIRDFVPCTDLHILHDQTSMQTNLYQLYDGTLKLWGCQKLLWHRIPLKEADFQVMKQPSFPFEPEHIEPFVGTIVNTRPYFDEDSNDKDKQACAQELLQHLQADGFCMIRGTGLDASSALEYTHQFLQVAPEAVRRSSLARDRARRGYSPMNTENFASLLGNQARNDLVRKFRLAAIDNVWPSDWEACEDFRTCMETYFAQACQVSETILQAIWDALQVNRVVDSTNTKEASHILTLLSYGVTSRHSKSKGPLVAAHTDVGVITLLTCDDGDCARLQRLNNSEWIDVSWPTAAQRQAQLDNDTIFVVNIADCLSDMTGLPSTVHRVVAHGKTQPRNCLALFHGLEPQAKLCIEGEEMTYEEWRKRRIARAQEVLAGKDARVDRLNDGKF